MEALLAPNATVLDLLFLCVVMVWRASNRPQNAIDYYIGFFIRHILNSLEGVIQGIMCGTTFGVIKGVLGV